MARSSGLVVDEKEYYFSHTISIKRRDQSPKTQARVHSPAGSDYQPSDQKLSYLFLILLLFLEKSRVNLTASNRQATGNADIVKLEPTTYRQTGLGPAQPGLVAPLVSKIAGRTLSIYTTISRMRWHAMGNERRGWTIASLSLVLPEVQGNPRQCQLRPHGTTELLQQIKCSGHKPPAV
jgi:hypothetical protein